MKEAEKVKELVIKALEDLKALDMEIIDDSVEILSVTERGYGKRTQVSQYRRQRRGRVPEAFYEHPGEY